MSQSLPSNVHVSSHPCLQAKLSQLRDSTANSRETKALVHEISLIIGCEALAASLTTKSGPPVRTSPSSLLNNVHPTDPLSAQAKSPLGYEYTTTTISPSTISLVPILRSGLGMVGGTSLSSPLFCSEPPQKENHTNPPEQP